MANQSRYPHLGLMTRALSSLGTAERDLREAGLAGSADQILEIVVSARCEFMIAWEEMLKAEGRWSEDEGAQRLQMAMARVYLGDI